MRAFVLRGGGSAPSARSLFATFAGVADMPMPDRPLGSDSWGITDFEERNGEPLGRRLAHERPEGRDIATDDGATSDTLSAEEAVRPRFPPFLSPSDLWSGPINQ